MSEPATINFGDLLVSPPEYGANATAIAPEDGNPRYLRITDIDDEGHLLHDDVKSISAIVAQPYLLAQDDIVIARTGNTVGKAYRHDTSNGPLAFAGYLVRFRVDQNKADPGFVSQFLHSPHYRAWVQRTLRTGAQPNINAAEYKKLPIPTFKPNTQRRIATILSTMDEVIEATEKLVEKHQQIKAGLMHDLFTRGLWTREEIARGDHKGLPCEATAQAGQLRPTPEEAPGLYQDSPLGLIPRAWSFGPLADFLHGRPKNGYSPQEVSEWSGLLALGLGCLTREGFSPHHLKTVGAGSIACNDALLADGDLLISRSNTRELVGLCGIYRDVGSPCIYPDLMMRIRPNGRTSAGYLEELLLSPLMRNQITGAAVGTSGSMVKLNSRSVLGLQLSMPGTSEQEGILAIIRMQRASIETQLTYLAKLRQQKQGLMHDLLTGRVRVE